MTLADYNTAVDLHADGIYRFALKHLRDADRAKDVVQERSTRMEEHHQDMNHTSQHQPDLKEVLDAALATLPAVQRSVVLLRDLEGYTYEEIAALTQLNLAQVKVYIYRGRTALKEYIGQLDLVI